ncbi:MAG: hypothetical protein HN337_08490 [Deltaproteobacteria bacterium]|jgi:hypothetical protein|nr:hypothetical protein [Deltaproteobacteria bacterium]
MEANTNNRQRMIAALSVQNDAEAANELSDFMSNDDSEAHASLVKNYLNEENREYSMRRIVKHLVSSEKFSSLSEVHPAWILEKLRDEPPRVIGIILRFLPSQHVRYILKNLPPILCQQVPNMVESFSVDPEILDVIRRKFESNFITMRITRSIDHLGFENLYYLKEAELEEMFIELGITELAIALSTMSTKVLRIIYNRLDLKDARRLKAKIKELPADISSEIYRQARSSLLQIDCERVGPKQLLKILGLGAFAEAVGHGHDQLIRMIQQRLDPKDGYMLKRYIDEKRVRPSAVSPEERRHMILRTVAAMAREERIEAAWKGFSSDTTAEESSDKFDSPLSWDEETNTLHQLA